MVDDILENWTTLSHDSKFHAIFATSSIPEAIQYYKLFKAKGNLKITALFDPSIDNNGNGLFKEEGIVEIIKDYNTRYSMEFQMATYATFKKDISYRLAHKEQYKGIEHTSDQQIDLLIVVDQMLTGFDSKWINTLYLDKILVYEKLIQAFSRTNRLYGPEKPFGTIRYYRKPYTMQKNIEEAFKLYSGDRPLGLFADKLEHNLEKMNALYDDIGSIFRSAGIENFEKLPVDHTERGQFAKLFKQLNSYLEAAKIQGFTWNKLSYTGTLSHVEKYTTWHIGYRAMHSKQHIRLHFTDGNVYFVYTLEDRTLLSIPAGERLSLRLYRDPRRGTSACDIRSDSRVFQTMERSSQLAHRDKCLLHGLFCSGALIFLAIGFFSGLGGFRQYFSSLAARRRREKRKRARQARFAKEGK